MDALPCLIIVLSMCRCPFTGANEDGRFWKGVFSPQTSLMNLLSVKCLVTPPLHFPLKIILK